jgi:hypothetical protein
MRSKLLNTTFGTALAIAASLSFAPKSSALAPGTAQAQASAGQGAIAKRIGAIKSVSGSNITLAPDSGPEVTLTVDAAAHIMRIAPGEKDLKNAVPIQLGDLKIGDRIRARGPAPDEKSMTVLEIVVIPHSDIEARQEQERQDWQKRGLGGLVKSVDAASGTVTISVTSLGGSKSVDVHAAKETMVRRYAPDSVKFDDAKVSSIKEIQPGDQLRARGNRSPDGSTLTAEEIVTGSFKNVAGTVNSIDASTGTLNVQDLLSRKSVQIKVTQESQLHKLPPEMAQRIATRLKAAMPPGMPGAAAPSSSTPPSGAAAPGNAGGAGGSAGGMRSGGAPDFQQMLSRMPAVALGDLKKGDAVLIVATEGSASSGGTAITLLSGVEPILQAAPSGSQAMMLTPWSLGGAPGGDAGSQ